MALKKLLLSVAAASLLAGPVFADGGPVPEMPPAPPPEPAPEAEPAPEPAPPPAWTWTGPYIGAQIGYMWGDAEHVFDNGAPTDHSNPEGFVAGAHAGYNFQTTNDMLFGIEVDFDWTDAEGEFDNTTGITSTGSTEINYQGTARIRIGWVADRSVVFLTAGGALADVEYGGGPSPAPPCCGFSKTDFGWVIGGGLEYAFTDHLSGRLEYRFTDYGTESDGLPPAFPGVTMAVDLSTHQARAGLSWHF